MDGRKRLTTELDMPRSVGERLLGRDKVAAPSLGQSSSSRRAACEPENPSHPFKFGYDYLSCRKLSCTLVGALWRPAMDVAVAQ